MGRVFSNSSVILCLTMFWIESPNEGDAVALAAGCETGLLLLAERMIAGAKITEAIESRRNNTATMRIARARGESPLRVPTLGREMIPRRTFPIRAGGAGLPIVSA